MEDLFVCALHLSAVLQPFSSKPRSAVSVREGQAVVLLCGPPPHFGGKVHSVLEPVALTACLALSPFFAGDLF